MARLRCPNCGLGFEGDPQAAQCPRCAWAPGMPKPPSPVAAAPAPAPAGTRTSPMATWAFVCAVAPLGLFLLSALFESVVYEDGVSAAPAIIALQGIGSIVMLGGPIAAIVMGVVARKDPTITPASRNLALAAIIIGAITLGLYVLAILFVLLLIAACASACTTTSSATAVAAAPCGALTTGRHAARPTSWRDSCAHHPDHPAFAQDVVRFAGLRVCVGCLTVYPAFLATFAATWLWPVPGAIAWTVGPLLASLQGISMMGWARLRWQKVAVKASLGVGGALVLRAILDAPWPELAKSIAVAACGLVALASTQPRLRRMAAIVSSPA